MPTDELYADVRRALTHLYDAVYLQRSPLARLACASGREQIGDGRALRQMLLEAIEALKPLNSLAPHVDEQRPYIALRGRYVEQLAMADLAAEMGVSERQLRREIRAGIEAVAHAFQARGASSGQTEGESLACEELARIEQEGPSGSSANLAAEVRDLMLLVAPLARESGATLVEADLPESLMVRASRVLLRQALLSLLGRVIALHAGDTLQVGAREDEGEQVLLWLSPQQQLAAAQEPGDLIASEILETLGARTGYVRTPTGRPQYQLWLQPAPLQTVLVIDDNESLQRLFRRYLTGLPYAVLGAQSAEQGLALAQERIPSIILLDIMMPRQDGWDLLHALRNRPALNQIPVVICSVLSQEPLARSLGVAGYLKKPVSQDELLRMVQSVLSGGARQ